MANPGTESSIPSSLVHPPMPASVPSSSLQTAWKAALRQLSISAVLCTAVAVVLTLLFANPNGIRLRDFGTNWIYSICIGTLIQGFIEASRRGLSAWLRQRHPANEALHHNWPGWAWMTLVLAVAVPLGYLLGATFADHLTGNGHVARLLGGRVQSLTVSATVSVLAAIGATYYFYALGRLRHAEARAEAERRVATEHQLKLLESQLEPHMLFNTLANLRVLIALDPPRAQQMLDRLIAFLRGTLGGSKVSEHSLASEFERLEDYLALMQVRMGPRLQVAFDLPAALRSAAVPALLLQPVVENAIKHGLEPQVEGGRIEITARADAQRLTLTVRDTGQGLGPSARAGRQTSEAIALASAGFGAGLVRQRLATLYGTEAGAELTAGPDGRGALATIHLPLRTLPGA